MEPTLITRYGSRSMPKESKEVADYNPSRGKLHECLRAGSQGDFMLAFHLKAGCSAIGTA